MGVAYNDDETLDQLKTWWQRYGTPLLLLIAAVLFSVAGWKWWSSKSLNDATAAQGLQQQLQAASQRLSLNAEDKAANTEFQRIGRQLIDEYARTPYATDAALLLAKRAVEAGDLAEAEKQLRWVLDNGAPDETEHLVRTRLARVLAAQKKPDAALAELDQVKDASLAPLVDEIRGDIHLAKGDQARAAAAYKAADAALAGRDEARPLLALKLAEVGLEPAPRKSDEAAAAEKGAL